MAQRIKRGGAIMRKVGFFGGKFLPLHAGHVFAITKAACMVEELYVVLSFSEARDRKLCEQGNISYIPHSVRLQWLSTLTKDMVNVKVIEVEDFADSDATYNWSQGATNIKNAIGKEIDTVFSSETSYEEIFNELYPIAEHIIIDAKRELFPISATMIREDSPYKHWDMIPEVVKPFFTKKVAIIGTESCGKSTVTKYLAQVYQTTFVEEYGRTICEELGGCDGIITEDHFKELVFGHKHMEYQKLKEANKVLFIDSEAVVSQYYSKLYLGYDCDWLEGVISSQNYDLYIFLEPDIPWVNDGLRVHGEQSIRMANNDLLKQMFNERKIPFVTISGSYAERFSKAHEHVQQLLLPTNSKVLL